MSETEHVKGSIEKVNLKGATLKDRIKELSVLQGITEVNWDILDDEDTLEMFRSFFYRSYFINDSVIYEVTCTDIDPDEEILEAERVSGGSIDFNLKWYNGGASFDEALEQALIGNNIGEIQ